MMFKTEEAEVERRLAEIRRDPERLCRYDRDGDGRIDADEWEEVRRVVEVEIQTELARKKASADKYSKVSADDLEDAETPAIERLKDRYELLREVGQGSQGQAFVGRDLSTSDLVLVKEMRMAQVEAWKAVELFDREAAALRSISHEAIPAFIDAFHISDADAGMRFFLVQEFIDGEDLQDLIDTGLTIGEAGARAFLRELLGVLDYLHTRDVPIIHRDIKPANILRRKDGRLALIDFGAVQSSVAESSQKTVVGTSGYMPMEQLMGRARPASDLYALAATVVHLLSRRHPADLPVVGMELQFQGFINVSAHFEQALEKMLSAHIEDRFQSAREVLDFLDAPPEFAASGAQEPADQAWNARLAAAKRARAAGGVQFSRPTEEDAEFFKSWSVNSGLGDPEKNRVKDAIQAYVTACKKKGEVSIAPPDNLPPPARFHSAWQPCEDGFRFVACKNSGAVALLLVALLSLGLLAGVVSVWGALAAEPIKRLELVFGSMWTLAILFFGLFAIAGVTEKVSIECSGKKLRVCKSNLLRTNFDETFLPGATVEVRHCMARYEKNIGFHLQLLCSPVVDPSFAHSVPVHEQLYIRQEMKRYLSENFSNEELPADRLEV